MTSAAVHHLRRLCRPNQGTATEIVSAAWSVTKEQKITAQQLIASLPDCRSVIQNAAMNLGKDLQDSGGIGFVVGVRFNLPIERDPGFIPIEFVKALYESD